ncbi:MAG TPA: ATP-binding protein [Longimicrobiales bacterium]|nr:ATP-binding protein [Longimicrobiales bacterium]
MKRIQAERSVLGAFGATVLTLYLLVWWTRQLEVGWLIAATAALISAVVLTWLAWRRRAAPGPLVLSLGLLLLGTGFATVTTWQFDRIGLNWNSIVEQRQARMGAELNARMSDVVERGMASAQQAAAIAGSRSESTDMFRPLATLLEQYQVDGLALYTQQGGLLAWAGEHRGELPDTLWMREMTAYFEERPLFSYVYFPVLVPGREEYAIAAVLVETGVISDGSDGGIGEVVEARTQTRASFRSGGGTDEVWSLVVGGDTIVHARLEPLTQRSWRERLERTARVVVLLSVLFAFIALCVAWLRSTGPTRPPWAAALPLAALLPVVMAAPLRETFGAERLFSPVLFTLPPRDNSLGALLAVLLPLTALVAGARRRQRPVYRPALRIAAGALVVAAAYPLVLRLLFAGTTTTLLEGTPAYWYAFQLAAVLILSIVTLFSLPRRNAPGEKAAAAPTGPRQRLLLAGAVLLSIAFAVLITFAGDQSQRLPLFVASLWLLPFALGAAALAPESGRSGALSRLLLAGWLAGTAVLPHMWRAHVDARLAAAERQLESLGTRADPFLHYLLEDFGNQARDRFAAGETGVQLLYRTWVASGLAQQPYPARIVLWSGSGESLVPEVQLGSAPMPRVAEERQLDNLLRSARSQTSWAIIEFSDVPDLSRLLTVPLADGSLITVMVPPRRTLDRISAVAPFLGVIAPATTRLNLVEASGPEPQQTFIEWQPSVEGWRSEAFVKYPDGWFHAHLAVSVAPAGVRLARGMLLIAFDLTLLALLWVIGVVGRGGAAFPRGGLRTWLDTFRARITVALFGFFLVPTLVFGWVAYRALAGEVARVAQTWAQYSVSRVVLEFQEGVADLPDLAAHAGTDVLRYINGELIAVSSREALDLGVYGAWMPPDVFNRLETGEDLSALATQNLGDYSYITAYHAVRPSGTLGVPMSLSSGETAVRQREFAHLVLFAVVVGALLSLALSVAVGRALAGPIGQLRRASAAVGAGRFGVQLPEREGGEFGQLFTSFNRMARRLRRARARELRTARVLAWGEMARQVAHEIKNPLTPIKLSVQHLRRAYADRHPQFEEVLESNVSQILTEIDRLSEIARAFSRYGAPNIASGPLTPVDVPAVIREALTLYRSGDRTVRYIDDVQPDLPRARARSNELKEVLLNLVENARAALDGPGDIIISAYETDSGHIDIDVADTGPGIPEQNLARVFEPHFSTRSSGTGLGLAIVRRLVESWEGTVTAASREGGGTVVRIRLLIADRETRPAAEGGGESDGRTPQ